LRQSVYFLRHALGAKAIVSRGDEELALAPDQVRCDVWAFEAGLDQGRPADALALYRGELLAGFHISAAPDFERWLEEERSRLRQRAVEGGWARGAGGGGAGGAGGRGPGRGGRAAPPRRPPPPHRRDGGWPPDSPAGACGRPGGCRARLRGLR